MRIIVSFYGGGLTINFEDITTISNDGDRLILHGGDIRIVVNASDICVTSLIIISKSWLLTADEVYLDTRIEED